MFEYAGQRILRFLQEVNTYRRINLKELIYSMTGTPEPGSCRFKLAAINARAQHLLVGLCAPIVERSFYAWGEE